MARILFTTLGSLGDIHPLMAIGFELQRLGHGVVIATSDRHGQRVKDAGFEFAEIPPQFPKAEDQPRLMQRWMDPKSEQTA
ncbi:MAG: glycosyltransferase [bacterium]